MARFTVFGRFESHRIPAIVPPSYRALIPSLVDKGRTYTILLFDHDRASVVLSGPVRRALARIPADEPVLAIGACFTADALDVLEARGARVARLGGFHWTDESYLAIRALR